MNHSILSSHPFSIIHTNLTSDLPFISKDNHCHPKALGKAWLFNWSPLSSFFFFYFVFNFGVLMEIVIISLGVLQHPFMPCIKFCWAWNSMYLIFGLPPTTWSSRIHPRFGAMSKHTTKHYENFSACLHQSFMVREMILERVSVLLRTCILLPVRGPNPCLFSWKRPTRGLWNWSRKIAAHQAKEEQPRFICSELWALQVVIYERKILWEGDDEALENSPTWKCETLSDKE